MEYSEQFEYLEKKGFTFKFDVKESIYFSPVHVLWNGAEYGTMYKDYSWITDVKNGGCRQFHYSRGWYTNQDFYDIVDRITTLSGRELSYSDEDDKKKRSEVVRNYFNKRRV